MIDRGALVLALRGSYRGLHRTPLDGMTFTGRKGRSLAERYTHAVIAGDGVLEDLDEAIALRNEARKLGLAVEAVIFDIPHEPRPPSDRVILPVVDTPPVPEAVLLGWDVVEALEPWDSLLTDGKPELALNAHGLLNNRVAAETLAAGINAQAPEEPWVPVRVWGLEVAD